MVSVWGMTDKGIVRRENQDSCAYDIIEEGKLAWGVVCDGMGGAKAGDVASKMAVEAFCTQMDQLGDLEGPPPAEALLRTATEDANRVVYLKAQTDADCIGMGTTLVGLILQEATLWVVNVGDSRAYRITKGGIRRITRDHSVVEDLVARGDLTPEPVSYTHLDVYKRQTCGRSSAGATPRACPPNCGRNWKKTWPGESRPSSSSTAGETAAWPCAATVGRPPPAPAARST